MQAPGGIYYAAGPSSDPFGMNVQNESTIWDLLTSESTSNSSEYEEDGNTSADSNSWTPRFSGGRRKSLNNRATLRTPKARRKHRPRNLKDVQRHETHTADARVASTSLRTPVSPPLKPSDAAEPPDGPDLDNVWKLLHSWYMLKGYTKRPPCAVEYNRLDQLHSIGTRENACHYEDRQGHELQVTSRTLRGWEQHGLHIIIAFRDDQDPVIIMGRGTCDKEKGKDQGTTRFPFYIWQGISGDEEGWESEPSIFKVVRYSNPSFYEPTNLKKRRVDTPKSSAFPISNSDVHRGSKRVRKVRPLLSESFPGLSAQLNEWLRHVSSGKDPPFVLLNQPDLYLSKSHPEQRITYVDADRVFVNASLYSIGIGNKHVIVAHGPSLEPTLISWDHLPKLPKYYSAYYKWTSATTWIEPPCVFKVFGAGPYASPRELVDSLSWSPQVYPSKQGVFILTLSGTCLQSH